MGMRPQQLPAAAAFQIGRRQWRADDDDEFHVNAKHFEKESDRVKREKGKQDVQKLSICLAHTRHLHLDIPCFLFTWTVENARTASGRVGH